MKVCFSILHYKNFNRTNRCVSSLLKLVVPSDYEVAIVIVDNCSGDDSLARLKEKFRVYKIIRFIESTENLGFARGNNLAFDYMKANGFGIGVFLNDDTEIVQSDFLEMLKGLYPFDVLSPDIFDPGVRQHQSPLYAGDSLYDYALKEAATSKEMLDCNSSKRMFLNAKAFSADVLVKIPFLVPFFQQQVKAPENAAGWNCAQEGIVPQGSAVIVGRNYIQKMDYAFYPGTTMFFEEAILKVLCDKKSLVIRYSSKLQVLHHHFEIRGYIKKNYYHALKKKAEYMLKSFAILCKLAGWDNPYEE